MLLKSLQRLRARNVLPSVGTRSEVLVSRMRSPTVRQKYLSCLSSSLRFQSTTTDASRQTRPFDKVLVANRGEIVERVMRTCRELDIATVAVHSTADSKARFVQLADETICIGPAAASDSYLNVEAVLGAMEQSGAQAIHPGKQLVILSLRET
jgi:hypothetical protein